MTAAELAMRFGIHSGPVTGGVLRGEKSRFQLFGDTVNTAARIESTGARNRIHLSKETADLIVAADKGSWIRMRDEKVVAKGKGEIQTYWLLAGTSGSSAGTRDDVSSSEQFSLNGSNHVVVLDKNELITKQERLISWSVDVLQRLLKQVVAMRGDYEGWDCDDLTIETRPGWMVLDEVQEVVTLPSKANKYKKDPASIELSPTVQGQLYDYVSVVASMYRENPFHSFQHATHVTQSLTKLLSRVVTPDAIDYDDMVYKKKAAATLHKYTYGITSDPLTQFSCAFSALIHDLDHPGVPNAQLTKEKVEIAVKYKNKSVAEQNSVDIAWSLLMQPCYKDLRACIYSSQAELNRFRQLVVNSVMATDIIDKELGSLRKKRWEKAFSESQEEAPEFDPQIDMNRKATIVIEHLIQAADVAHTMQHWHVFRKWNECLFHEMYQAYLSGRAEKDPSENWYKGELGFFDFYVIPLAKKLEDCGVFGVSSDECLNYAQANRREWEMKGKEIVDDYLKAFHGKRGNVADGQV